MPTRRAAQSIHYDNDDHHHLILSSDGLAKGNMVVRDGQKEVEDFQGDINGLCFTIL